jgi:OTU domain-containing protein 5
MRIIVSNNQISSNTLPVTISSPTQLNGEGSRRRVEDPGSSIVTEVSQSSTKKKLSYTNETSCSENEIISSHQKQFLQFEKELKNKKGFIIKKMSEDGNCLFRSIADQIYGDPEMHDQVRERCINYIKMERDHFSQFITEDFNDYVDRKKKNGCFGNNLEIQAIGEIYNRPIEIYTYNQNGLSMEPINIFHNQYSTDNSPIRLSYHNGNHYNSIIDPNNPSVGVGLGMPNLEPGLPDKLQLNQAIKQSEVSEIDDLLLKECVNEFDLSICEKQIEEAVLEQSMLEIEESILFESQKEFYNLK